MMSLEDYEALEETAYLLRIRKPDPLKHGLAGYWSRQITDEHRIVYKVEGNAVFIALLRYQY